MVQAMEARALTFGQVESATQASRSAFPQSADRSFEAMAPRLPGSTSFLAAEAAQTARLEATIAALEASVEELSLLPTDDWRKRKDQVCGAAIAKRVIDGKSRSLQKFLLTLAAEASTPSRTRSRRVRSASRS